MAEQSDEEIRGVQSWRVLNTGTSLPWSWVGSSSQHLDIFTDLELLELCSLGIFMDPSSGRHDQLLSQSPPPHLPTPPSPLPSSEDGRWDWKFQAPNHGLVFLVTSTHPEALQESTKSLLIGTKDTPITQEIPRDLGTPCQELGTKTKDVFIMSQVVLSLFQMILHLWRHTVIMKIRILLFIFLQSKK